MDPQTAAAIAIPTALVIGIFKAYYFGRWPFPKDPRRGRAMYRAARRRAAHMKLVDGAGEPGDSQES
jgi:hypothetical protein